ncbi:enduracididine biosynthesis enzyme MppR [Lentzea sp. CA-135723]|uniref:enduracididine biosynthesis enzyme MppR n=1 Tax=Lentzea sp. CA-135723 TaxID=3239950 RepID=UPI003D923B4D
MTDRAPWGYSLPLSPSGRSAMLTPPPWHFSGDVLMVDYRVSPEAAAAFLPPELSPGPDPGAAAAVFAQWQWTSDDGAELEDPHRGQFGEFLILLACEFEGERLARCPYAWVDRAVPLVRGWLQGMPKQFGEIHQTRPASVGRAGPRIAPGGRFAGSVSVLGRRVAEAAVTLRSQAAEPPHLHTVPLAHNRVTPPWLPGEVAVSQLVASAVDGVEFSPVWSGDAELTLFDELPADLADLGLLAPVSVGQGHYFSYAETLHGGRPLSS